MAGVKEMGGSSLPAAMTAAEARNLEKIAEMDAGAVLIAEAAERLHESKKELEQEQSAKEQEREQEKEYRDTPELSRQSKWFGIQGKLLQNASIKWVLEMEEALWEELLNWMPERNTGLAQQFAELSRLYIALLEAILTHTIGEEQTEQIGRLDAVLATKLNLLLETNLSDLIDLLGKTEQKEAIKLIKAVIYKQVTGESISPGAADKLFIKGKAMGGNGHSFLSEAGTSQSGMGKRFSGNASESASSVSSAKEGMIYTLSNGRKVQVSQGFRAQQRSTEEQISQRNMVLNGNKNYSFSGKKTASVGDMLSTADRLARHMNGSGNLFQNAGISAKNEELAGILAAMTSIKGMVYSSGTERENVVNYPLKSAFDQMVDHYLMQRGGYKIYYYTTSLYEKTKNPQKAIEGGLEYAYKLFLEKKGDAAFNSRSAYSEQAGFFQMLLKGMPLDADIRKGMKILEENWREFLQAIGEGEKKLIALTMQKHSPWGMLFESEEIKKSGKEKKFLVEAICFVALVLLYFCFRWFFG
ncbi:MAG: hypothetical protein HFH53_05875 [Hespellia sp.]|nr:hypothetical protein [Hespellia sp.]